MTAQVIRDQDQYSGVRVRLAAGLATANERFHVDVNVGDPIWPAPTEIELPRLLGQPAISLRGYPMEMVLAEKTITALQLGIASTRWRDFGDIYQLTGQYHLTAETVRAAFEAVAAYRSTELTGTLAAELDGYAGVAQNQWFAWRSRHDLTDRLPESFQDVLDAVTAFADPVLTTTLTAEWVPRPGLGAPPPVHPDTPSTRGFGDGPKGHSRWCERRGPESRRSGAGQRPVTVLRASVAGVMKWLAAVVVSFQFGELGVKCCGDESVRAGDSGYRAGVVDEACGPHDSPVQ